MNAKTEIQSVKSRRRPSLLFVDDERRVLTSMRAMFRREYEVLLANSGEEALQLLAERSVDVVISDQRMPQMTGVELLTTVKAVHPRSMRILLTGYADLDAVEASINESEVFRYLMKPCAADELKGAVRLAVQAARVSELAGVDELTAVPAELLEAIELRDVSVPAEAAAEVKIEELPGIEIEAEVEPLLAPRQAGPQEVEAHVLVLSRDDELCKGVEAAIASRSVVHAADSVTSALQMLSEHPIGVLVTDTAVNEDEISSLIRTLKQEVPELVTVIASDRSDTTMLIGLINHGQIFRFLLKPLQIDQSRAWLLSALNKHYELCTDASEKLRHRVAGNSGVGASNRGLFAGVRDRLQISKSNSVSEVAAES